MLSRRISSLGEILIHTQHCCGVRFPAEAAARLAI